MRKKKLKGRLRRLEKAPAWIAERNGKPNNMLRRYKRYFGVDWECATAELNSLGLVFDPDYLAELRVAVGSALRMWDTRFSVGDCYWLLALTAWFFWNAPRGVQIFASN